MNHDDELIHIMHRCAAGVATPAEMEALATSLRSDAALRARYLDCVNLENALEAYAEAHAAIREVETESCIEFHQPQEVKSSPQSWRRPTAAALVGALLGASSVAAAWATMQGKFPAADVVASELPWIPLPVVNAGFESGVQPQLGGVPVRPQLWQGDVCEIVPAMGKVSPWEGSKMLRFTGLTSLPRQMPSTMFTADLWQVVPLPAGVASANGRAVVRARFNAETPPKTARFMLQAIACTEDPATLPEEWKLRLRDPIRNPAESHLVIVADGDPATWEMAEVTVALPEGAKCLLVATQAYRLSDTPAEQGLPAQFMDAVQVVFQPEVTP
jgi:hypothetical protein